MAVIRQKISDEENTLFPGATFSFREQETLTVDFQVEIDHLPYRFRDPVKLDRHPGKHDKRFGSRIGRDDPQREEYFTVTEVLGPGMIRLSDGRSIRLLGIFPDIAQENAAREFLAGKLIGKQVYLKYDRGATGNENAPACYVYLRNRTFVNAHLIRSGLVTVDTETEYNWRDKFIRLLRENKQKT
jgi:site-specific DNA-methyltransferase (adenine-specific)